MFYFHPYLGKIPILTNIFQMGWNHQLVMIDPNLWLFQYIWNTTVHSLKFVCVFFFDTPHFLEPWKEKFTLVHPTTPSTIWDHYHLGEKRGIHGLEKTRHLLRSRSWRIVRETNAQLATGKNHDCSSVVFENEGVWHQVEPVTNGTLTVRF